MSDDKTKTGGEDRRRINIHEDDELRDWARKYRVRPDRLREAVSHAGMEVSSVEQWLKSHG